MEISNISIRVWTLRWVPLGTYTCTALDALVFPTILGRIAHVVSPCRRTGEPVSVNAASSAGT
ncbi:organomercurial lyase [Mycolicibacter longobardus]|uniref:organomercurial lyase n=1 Tax=Mycolicibacter longobardus TaxID=1108812 RepID=UPI003B3B19FD